MVGRAFLVGLLCSLALGAATAQITDADLDAARESWGSGLVAVATAYDNDGIDAAKELATRMIDNLYGYQMGPVLFKPTLASGNQTFRPTREGAISYFVAHDTNYPLDGGFALKGWRSCSWETNESFMKGEVAMWMGWLACTDSNGDVTQVDKSFGYKKDEEGVLRIIQHHSSLPYQPPPPAPITEAELDEAREIWGAGLVAVSTAYDNEGIDAAKELATNMIDSAYGYATGPVLFKPTLASGEYTFRPTAEGAISYFVAHNPEYPLDGGFALKGWRSCGWTTSASFVEGDVAMWMGWLTCTDSKGDETQVDKSFGYERDMQGVLRIVLHHSSLPYQP